jgi:hypothetical protein
MGWMPDAATCIPKLYARYGDAYRTLRKLQAIDAEVMTSAGRRRRLERLAPEFLDALRWALPQIEDDLDPDHQAALRAAHSAVARADRILNGS